MTDDFPLSKAEWRVCRLYALGENKKLIAELLSITRNTVSDHINAAYIKLGCHSQVKLLIHALKKGWIKLEDL